MTTTNKTVITVNTEVNAEVEKVWNFWTEPRHIIRWNSASDDWQTTFSENDLSIGGRFSSHMEAKDGSFGFDFSGTYRNIEKYKLIDYILDDYRKVQITFKSDGDKTLLTETFEAEQINSVELQKTGWQSILNRFKKYAEEYERHGLMHFEVSINRSADIVYKTLTDKKKYEEWTFVFNATSHFIGSWKKGSKILFLGTGEDGKVGGMVSKIRENIPNKFISIEHTGIYKNGKEITRGPEVEGWAGSLENYTLNYTGGRTILSVDIDSISEFKTYFSETWPRALKKIKTICE